MKKMNIEVDNQTIARFWLILIAFSTGGFLIYWSRHGLILLGMAVFLAMALNPIVARLARKFFNGKRVLATTLTYIGVVAVVVIMGLLVIPTVIDQTANLVKTVPDLISNSINRLTEVNDKLDQWQLKSLGSEIVTWIDNSKGKWASSVGSSLFTGIGSVMTSAAATFMVLVVSFLILIDAPGLMNYLWSFYRRPKTRKHHQQLFGKMYRVITGFVSGQLTVALIDGATASILVLILHLIFGIPISIMAPVGLLATFLAFIPMIGATLAMIVGTLVVLLYGWQPALAFAISFVIYQQIEGNIIAPMVQSKKIEMSTLMVMVAIVMGLYMFGILGGIIAIPLAGCLKVLVEDYRIRARISEA